MTYEKIKVIHDTYYHIVISLKLSTFINFDPTNIFT